MPGMSATPKFDKDPTFQPFPAVEEGWPASPEEACITDDPAKFRGSLDAPIPSDDPYDALKRVLAEAVEQASEGKGKERHANEGEVFTEQQIVMLNLWLGSNHGDLFQVIKKAIESTRLPFERAKRELLGAINYAAAAILVLEEQQKK